MVAFATLDELPQILNPQMRKSIEAMYPSAMGQRFGEVPVELKATVAQLRRMVEGYEELYTKHGMHFMKSPEDMLRVWGVAGYVPHVPTTESLIAAGGAQEYVGALRQAGHKTSASRGGVEGALSMKMDARKLRQIDGTIAEINAMARDVDLVMTLDPMAVLGRYGQANKAVSAKEFVLTMMRGGVIKALRAEVGEDGVRKSMALVASEGDMVPLLERRIKLLEDELLFAGDRAAWERAGVQPEELLKTLRQTVSGTDEGVFATWFREIPELGALRKVEDFYTELRAREYFAGHELTDASRMRRMGMEWDDIAVKLNERAVKVDPAWGSTTKIDGRSLAQFFEDGEEAWRLYLPRVVGESMNDLWGRRPHAQGTAGLEALPGCDRDQHVVEDPGDGHVVGVQRAQRHVQRHVQRPGSRRRGAEPGEQHQGWTADPGAPVLRTLRLHRRGGSDSVSPSSC